MHRFAFLSVFAFLAIVAQAKGAQFVVIVTVDGLRSSIFNELTATELPHFTRLRREGVFTDNARTDYDWTYTNPNHVSILTARQVVGPTGHLYTETGMPPDGRTLHARRGFYLTSVYDIAHDRGQRTGAFVTKRNQFSIIDASYTATNGAPDLIDTDNGRDKIDVFLANNYLSDSMTSSFVREMQINPCHLSWCHFADPDDEGHGFGWSSPNYRNAVMAVDGYLGRILQLIANDLRLRGRTTLIVTSDHGGTGMHHFSATDPENYTIPFIVWGADVPRSGDLYFINVKTRKDPGTTRPPYGVATGQPIRNIDAGNLALKLLGLPAIPDAGAHVNQAQNLSVTMPLFLLKAFPHENGAVRLQWSSLGEGYAYRVERCADLASREWTAPTGTWPIKSTTWVDVEPLAATVFYRVVCIAASEGSATPGPLGAVGPSNMRAPKRARAEKH